MYQNSSVQNNNSLAIIQFEMMPNHANNAKTYSIEFASELAFKMPATYPYTTYLCLLLRQFSLFYLIHLISKLSTILFRHKGLHPRGGFGFGSLGCSSKAQQLCCQIQGLSYENRLACYTIDPRELLL